MATSTARRQRPDAAPARDLDLREPATRRILTRSAVPALMTLVAAWELTDQQAADLLGGVSLSTLRRWKKSPPEDLGVDGLTRASYLLGIYRALHVILDDVNADRWVALPNTGPMFGGRPPLDVMTRGGIPAMERVRLHLDAVRGGR